MASFSSSSTRSPRRWPNNAKAAVSFTMDNLGEAQAVRTGAHPPTAPIGRDPSVHHTLPRILDLLDSPNHGNGIKATYFAESWSLAVYPDAVAELRRRGHEIAWHGHQHEVWRTLSADDEAGLFAVGWEEASRCGVRYEGFRPPGGDVNGARTYGLLKDHGCKYVSPEGKGCSIEPGSGMVLLPFEWETVDAFWYMDKFDGVRRQRGVCGEPPPGPKGFEAYLEGRLGELVREAGYVSILFHPFLQTSEERFKVLEEVLARLAADPDIWVAPCNEVARWVVEHADQE